MKIFHYLVLSVMILILPVQKAISDDILSSFIDAQATFEQALVGDESKTELAQQKMNALVKIQPNHPLFNVYYGSSYTLLARDAWMPWTKISYAEKGLAIIDKALGMLDNSHSKTLMRGTSVSVETRLVAISTFLKVPGFMHRLDHAKQELDKLFSDDSFKITPPPVKSRIHFQAAQIAQREDNKESELSNLEKTIALDQEGRFAELAKERLAEIENTKVWDGE